jgi:monovalent cation:H+ antiporter-2, CPA2 family
LALVTAASKVFTGWWATQPMDLDVGSRLRAGITLIARGEFSLVIAMMGISAGLEPQLGTLSAAYVLITAVMGPLALRVAEPKLSRLTAKMPLSETCARKAAASLSHAGHTKSA